MKLGQTPSQTVGPYFHIRLGREGENILSVPEGGERIVVAGRVIDGDGRQVEDALVETWQANPQGGYNHPDVRRDIANDFTGFARATTDPETGLFEIHTVKPGPVPDPEGESQAPHISVIIQARGMLNPLFTRIYFSDEPAANDHDLVLGQVPSVRRHTLIAQLVPGSDPSRYEIDIRLQGEGETIFFDF